MTTIVIKYSTFFFFITIDVSIITSKALSSSYGEQVLCYNDYRNSPPLLKNIQCSEHTKCNAT